MFKQINIIKKTFIDSFKVNKIDLGEFTDPFVLNLKKNYKISFNK